LIIHIFHDIWNKTTKKIKKRKWSRKEKKRIPVQVTPSPEYPALQAQVKLPAILVHFAFDEHPPLLVEHSFISVDFDLDFIRISTSTKKRKPKIHYQHKKLHFQNIQYYIYMWNFQLYSYMLLFLVHNYFPHLVLNIHPHLFFFFFFFFWKNKRKNKSCLKLFTIARSAISRITSFTSTSTTSNSVCACCQGSVTSAIMRRTFIDIYSVIQLLFRLIINFVMKVWLLLFHSTIIINQKHTSTSDTGPWISRITFTCETSNCICTCCCS